MDLAYSWTLSGKNGKLESVQVRSQMMPSVYDGIDLN